MIDLIHIVMWGSVLASLVTSFYLFKLSGDLYTLGDSNKFEVILACIALAWAMVKNTLPINSEMTLHAVLLQEVFRLLIPVVISVIVIKYSRVLHKYESQKLNYIGIERRQLNQGK